MSLTEMLFVLGGMCLLLAIHPFVTYPLSLWVLGMLRRPVDEEPPANQCQGGFSICMCAYNEAEVIVAKMHNLLALRERDPSLKILVYVDAATDQTVAKLAPFAEKIDYLHVSPHRRGKTHGMNLLISQCQSSFVIFTDANVMLDLQVISNLKHHFADPLVGCVCGNLIYTNADESVTAATGSAYWRLEQAIKALEQRTGSVMGADGSLFAIRRSLHRPPPEHIIDDMYVSFRILCQGYRLIQAPDVLAYEKSATSARDEFQRKKRIACQAFNVHRLLWPYLRKLDRLTLYKYLSHKLLRWLSIYFLATGMVLLELGLILQQWLIAATTLPVLLAAAIVIGQRWSVTPFSQGVEVLRSLLGAGLGVWQSLRGERYQTWTPAASVRKWQ